MFKRMNAMLALAAASFAAFAGNMQIAEHSITALHEAFGDEASIGLGRTARYGGSHVTRSRGGRAHRRWAHARASGLHNASRS